MLAVQNSSSETQRKKRVNKDADGVIMLIWWGFAQLESWIEKKYLRCFIFFKPAPPSYLVNKNILLIP